MITKPLQNNSNEDWYKDTQEDILPAVRKELCFWSLTEDPPKDQT